MLAVVEAEGIGPGLTRVVVVPPDHTLLDENTEKTDGITARSMTRNTLHIRLDGCMIEVAARTGITPTSTKV